MNAQPSPLVSMAAAGALNALVGLPYRRGARGPTAFDCWGLVLEVRRRLGQPLPPDVARDGLTPEQVRALLRAQPAEWVRVEPALGAIVLASDAAHAGVLVGLRVLHTQAHAGVVAWTFGHWAARFGALECWEVRRHG